MQLQFLFSSNSSTSLNPGILTLQQISPIEFITHAKVYQVANSCYEKTLYNFIAILVQCLVEQVHIDCLYDLSKCCIIGQTSTILQEKLLVRPDRSNQQGLITWIVRAPCGSHLPLLGQGHFPSIITQILASKYLFIFI